MLIETSQMQRLIIALGHPTYALSVVLFGLLLSSGVGSFLTAGVGQGSIRGRRYRAADRARRGARRARRRDAPSWCARPPEVRRRCASAPRSRCCFPAGLLLGMAFPLGMKLAAGRGRAAALTPWLWGLNGAASVVASVLSVCIALAWSISTAFWTGCAVYAVAPRRVPRGVARRVILVLP
jgi:hypothetical protein